MMIGNGQLIRNIIGNGGMVQSRVRSNGAEFYPTSGGGVIVLDCVGHEVERLGTTVQMNMCV